MTINPAHTAALMSVLDRRPYFALLGMRFRAMDPGYCRIDAAFIPEIHGNAFGAVHGGVYASLIDSAAYWALYCQMPEEQGYTSLDLNVTCAPGFRLTWICCGPSAGVTEMLRPCS